MGSIPAWAGEPAAAVRGQTAMSVYPRVGGGTVFQGRPCDVLGRSIPAWAGEPSQRSRRRPGTRVYPRVGGGTPRSLHGDVPQVGLSPRGRGNHLCLAHDPVDRRSIPAWAGEPPRRLSASSAAEVYPRVGGGTPNAHGQPDSEQGLSPRGRGNHPRPNQQGNRKRSIPAWAGEPGRRPTGCPLAGVYPRVGGGTQ